MKPGLLELAVVASLAPSIVSVGNGLAADEYDCFALHPWGIANILVLDDWMLLDDDNDGLECHLLQP